MLGEWRDWKCFRQNVSLKTLMSAVFYGSRANFFARTNWRTCKTCFRLVLVLFWQTAWRVLLKGSLPWVNTWANTILELFTHQHVFLKRTWSFWKGSSRVISYTSYSIIWSRNLPDRKELTSCQWQPQKPKAKDQKTIASSNYYFKDRIWKSI